METTPRRRNARAADLATVAVFLIALGLPLGGLFLQTPGPLEENRERYKFPPVSTDRYVHHEFAALFELYLGDRIGFRDELLAWHRRITCGVLHKPVTDTAWIGADGWFYLNQSDPFRNNPKMPSAAARADLWIDALAAREAWCRARGIAYIVAFAPDKAAVYPEHLRGYPQRHPPLEFGTPMAERLKERGVKCLNLLPAIRAEKARHPERLYYYKTDSHWNPDGARAGYWPLAEAVRERFPDFRPHGDADYSRGAGSGGDLRTLAGIRDDVPREASQTYEPLTPIDYRHADGYFSADRQAERLDKNPSLVSSAPSATGPTTLFLTDSFGGYLIPFLFSDFRQVSCINTYGFPPEAVRIEKPGLIIQLSVARQLYSVTPTNPPEIAAPR